MKNLLMLWVWIFIIGFAGCVEKFPTDFRVVIDGNRAESVADTTTEHVYLEIGPNGKGNYIIYDTGGTITHDPEGKIVIQPEQILEEGLLRLNRDEMVRIWQGIEDYQLFDLTEDYRMSIGGTYAFLILTANEQTLTVDNIGMEVLEIEAFFNTLNTVLPNELALEYNREVLRPFE
jgi:hypothetical protein